MNVTGKEVVFGDFVGQLHIRASWLACVISRISPGNIIFMDVEKVDDDALVGEAYVYVMVMMYPDGCS